MKRIENYVSKKTMASIGISILIVLCCFSIVILKVFNPYHRHVAIGLYILSWIFFIYPLLHHLNMRRLQRNPEVKWVKKRKVAILSTIAFIIILYMLLSIFPAGRFDFAMADQAELDKEIDTDLLYLKEIMISADSCREDLLRSGLLEMTIESSDPQRSNDLKEKFAACAEHVLVLENLADKYKYFYQINLMSYPRAHQRAFLISYGSYMAKYKLVSDISNSASPYAEVLMDENLGYMGDKTLRYLKSGFAKPKTIIRLNTGRAYLEYITAQSEAELFVKDYAAKSYAGVSLMDYSTVSADNMMDTFEANLFDRWLPVQRRFATFLGDTRVTMRHDNFVSEDQIRSLYGTLEPGDIFFQRRNWYISNVGMPGFWTHAGMYVGTLETLDEYFQEESQEMLGMKVSEYVQKNYPKVFEDKNRTDADGNYLTTIEGKAPGVVMLPLEESFNADYISVIRPRVSKESKLQAILFAFSNYQKPYDYDFDFSTDDEFVCSELVYKAYLAPQQKMNFTLTEVAGRAMLSPNDMVRQFAEEYGSGTQQSDFVIFLDGDEEKGIAEEKAVGVFLLSSQRPKYDIMLG